MFWGGDDQGEDSEGLKKNRVELAGERGEGGTSNRPVPRASYCGKKGCPQERGVNLRRQGGGEQHIQGNRKQFVTPKKRGTKNGEGERKSVGHLKRLNRGRDTC